MGDEQEEVEGGKCIECGAQTTQTCVECGLPLCDECAIDGMCSECFEEFDEGSDD